MYEIGVSIIICLVLLMNRMPCIIRHLGLLFFALGMLWESTVVAVS